MTSQSSQSKPKTASISVTRPKQSFWSAFFRWEWVLVALLILVIVVNSLISPYFLQADNIFRTVSDFMEMGLMMLAMAFIIVTGNIDLSVASTLAMTASFMGWLFNNGWNIWAAAAAALVLGALAGLLNGYLIAKVRLPALVVTLGTYAFYRGIAYVLLGDQAARGYPESFTYLGQGKIGSTPIPFSLVLFLGFALIFGLVLHKTTFGRYLFAIGNNENTCRYSGVNVDGIKISIFVISALMATLAGIILAARFGSTRPDIGLGLELDVITATVLGGIDILGGSGTMVGALLSLFLIGTARFGMSLMNIQGQVQSIAIGFLLILAIFLPYMGKKLSGAGGRMAVNPKFLLQAGAVAVVAIAFGSFFSWSRAPILATPAPVAQAPTATVAAVVLKPTATPVQVPPTPTPRPSPTPMPTSTPQSTTAGQSEPAASPTPTEPPQPVEDMIAIPAGPFILGSDDYEPNETPQQTIELAAFEIDRFEVTNDDFMMFSNATGYQTVGEMSSIKKTWRFYIEGNGNHPVVKVDWNDAVAYCAWLGKRLPTEQEWEKAARGEAGNIFPWGNAFDPTKTNIKASGIRGTVAVGSFPGGASPYGVEDMAGNVWEWTADPYQGYPNSTFVDKFYSDDFRVTRGGGWFDDEAQVRSSNRSAAAINAANDDLGFRCAR